MVKLRDVVEVAVIEVRDGMMATDVCTGNVVCLPRLVMPKEVKVSGEVMRVVNW
jgi:hypothetical protein